MIQRSRARLELAEQEEETRVARVLTYIALAAILFLLSIGLKSWFAGQGTHGLVLWGFAALLLTNLLVSRFLNNPRVLKTSLLTSVALLFIYLVASGGENNTGPLWLYVFPPLLFYLTDLKTGTLLILICILLTAIVFGFPDLPFVTAEYDADFKLRFYATIAFETLFCFILESGRRQARGELLAMASMHEKAARTDELTGLANRRDMQQRIAIELSRYHRSGHHFSIILIDLDLFKRINDDYGHDAGDLVLQRFARLMESVCRQTDVAARWGGEEFLLLLPDTSLLQALVLAERLREQVEETVFEHNGQHLPVTISAGVATVSQASTADDLLKHADIHLYEAKEAGRNRIVPRVRSGRPSASEIP